MKLLLDTCVLSELQRPEASPAVVSLLSLLPEDRLFVSVITLGEIVKGIALLAEGRRKRQIGNWHLGLCAAFADRILPIDREAAEIWGEGTAAARRRGVVLPAADGLIAASALRHELHVATRNTAHFEAAGMMVVDPWSRPTEA
ncbi:type II toxin-antitoxin system VapC family toxin [Singulisphaera sp. PoT]|uniref:type II toxin-antitoxin system VapC family toxin n=1 Tax=Singulisphaera sp. PoT TaxID=3411797 RepID=UPI003BF51655